jgi:alkaline phosphatase D
VTLSDSADLSDFHTEGALLYPKAEADVQETYEEFLAHPDPRFKVYRRVDVPAYLHFDANPRAGDPVIVPTGPFTLRARATDPEGGKHRGGHGFNPRTMPEMKAIFFAAGPDIRAGVQLKPFENVNIYPFLAEILGLKPPVIDGTLEVLRPALKTPRDKR